MIETKKPCLPFGILRGGGGGGHLRKVNKHISFENPHCGEASKFSDYLLSVVEFDFQPPGKYPVGKLHSCNSKLSFIFSP